jgi:hypothetical protein
MPSIDTVSIAAGGGMCAAGCVDDCIDVDAGDEDAVPSGEHVIEVNELLNDGDGLCRCHGKQAIIPETVSDYVSEAIAPEGMDNGNVGDDRRNDDIFFAAIRVAHHFQIGSYLQIIGVQKADDRCKGDSIRSSLEREEQGWSRGFESAQFPCFTSLPKVWG